MQPALADCGHSACLGCWKKWLEKNNTCPKCRKETTMKNLAKMVFEKEAGSGAPTLTQICENSSSDDEDEELEIVAG